MLTSIAVAETLPSALETYIGEFLAEGDTRVQQNLTGAGFEPDKVQKFATLWSMGDFCLAVTDLTANLRAEGFDATNLINDQAFSRIYDLGEIGSFKLHRSHTVARLCCGSRDLYIDPFWQQFASVLSLDITDIEKNPDLDLQPRERVLCYDGDDIEDVAIWFAGTVRTAQDKAKSDVLLGKTNMFTRTLSVADAMLNRESALPVSYMSMEELEAMARQIWTPSNYRILDGSELEKLRSRN